jgi:tetratricopeptide (TPR) repeat protein
MVTPGLLPEADDRRPSPYRWTVPFIVATLIAVIVYLIREREQTISKVFRQDEAYAAQARKREADVGRIRELEARITELQKTPPPAAVEAPPPAPAKAPDVRILPPELASERLTQGLHEFRSGRYAQAEACFLRAVPEGFLYLVLTCLERGDVREAMLFLGRAMASDPQWLRRVRPRDLFGSPAEYEKMLKAIEERCRENPLDLEAKTLLAYLHFHEKGPEHAKALLTEVSTAQPGHPAAQAFLEAVDRP